jgi:DNA polymerase III subunit epsilon
MPLESGNVRDAITTHGGNNVYIFFDTETTGLCNNKLPASDPGQPHICQLGAILTDQNGRVKAEVNLLVRPEGWVIPQAASDIHGITQYDADAYGLSIKGILTIFNRLLIKAEKLIAHNIRFDLFMLEIECARTGISLELPHQYACTMEDSRDILKIPPTQKMAACGMTEFKKPNLQEAYRHFFGREFEGAHDAMADVRACRDVFFAIQKLAATSTTGAAA